MDVSSRAPSTNGIRPFPLLHWCVYSGRQQFSRIMVKVFHFPSESFLVGFFFCLQNMLSATVLWSLLSFKNHWWNAARSCMQPSFHVMMNDFKEEHNESTSLGIDCPNYNCRDSCSYCLKLNISFWKQSGIALYFKGVFSSPKQSPVVLRMSAQALKVTELWLLSGWNSCQSCSNLSPLFSLGIVSP